MKLMQVKKSRIPFFSIDVANNAFFNNLQGASKFTCSPQLHCIGLWCNSQIVVYIIRTTGNTFVTEVYSTLTHGAIGAGGRRLICNIITIGLSPVCPFEFARRIFKLRSRRRIQMIIPGSTTAGIDTTVDFGLICPISAIAISTAGEGNRNRGNAQQGNERYGTESNTSFHGDISFRVHLGRQIGNLAI